MCPLRVQTDHYPNSGAGSLGNPLKPESSSRLVSRTSPSPASAISPASFPPRSGATRSLVLGVPTSSARLGKWLVGRGGKKTIKGELQISHRCHNPLCTIPDHVVLESARDNNNRKGCAVWANCPHCPLKVRVCPHEPMCIRYVPGFETWEQFVENGLH